MNILQSASKVVFILMAMGAIALTTMGIMDVKDFFVLVSMAFAFYFSKPMSNSNDIMAGK